MALLYEQIKDEARGVVRDWLDDVKPPTKLDNITLRDITDLINKVASFASDVQDRATKPQSK